MMQSSPVLPWKKYSYKETNLAQEFKLIPFLGIFLISFMAWNIAPPQGLSIEAWHLFIIFLGTIINIIYNSLPMGAVALIGMLISVVTHTLTIEACFKGFGNEIVWLVVFAFFIAKGFIKSGLGVRAAYLLIRICGKTSLGLAYGLVIADFLLAMTIPSNTARGIGIIFPILKSLANEQGSCPQKGTQRKIGAFLIKVSYQANVISSAMFLTALVGNSLSAKIAKDIGIIITWQSWALAALIPGIFNLALLPFFIYFLYPPELKLTPTAPILARKKLKELGSLNTNELIVLGIFSFMLVLWIFGSFFNLSSTTTALIGCVIFLCTGILSWEEILDEKNAWSTLIWLAILVGMVSSLYDLGFINWTTNKISYLTFLLPNYLSVIFFVMFYYYSHYFFASATTHIIAMYPPFLLALLKLNVPSLLAAFLLAVLSNLSAGLTHYGNSSAPVYYGAGFLTLREWWGLGWIVGIANLAVWFFIGGIWWKVIGLL